MSKSIVHIGELDRIITLQTYSVAQSASGHETVTYSNLATNVWAAVEYPFSGSDEQQMANRKTAIARTIFTIRNEWESQIDEKCRIVFNSTNYDITAIAISPDKQFMQLETEKRD